MNVYSILIHNNQEGKQPKCPLTNEWINKMVYNEYYSAIKRNEVLIHATI